tara:strand:+ start:399 stop:587 length:189 start_codon:yes stop_codon:yes gene_type:complete
MNPRKRNLLKLRAKQAKEAKAVTPVAPIEPVKRKTKKSEPAPATKEEETKPVETKRKRSWKA